MPPKLLQSRFFSCCFLNRLIKKPTMACGLKTSSRNAASASASTSFKAAAPRLPSLFLLVSLHQPETLYFLSPGTPSVPCIYVQFNHFLSKLKNRADWRGKSIFGLNISLPCLLISAGASSGKQKASRLNCPDRFFVFQAAVLCFLMPWRIKMGLIH